MTQNQDFSFSAELAPRFNRLNRAVLTAEKAEEWQPAIAEMTSFLLQVEADMTVADIAQATGVAEETAKSRLRYARSKLRQALEGQI